MNKYKLVLVAIWSIPLIVPMAWMLINIWLTAVMGYPFGLEEFQLIAILMFALLYVAISMLGFSIYEHFMDEDS